MKWRVYFNRHADIPLVWSIDNGDINHERHVRHVSILGCDVTSHYRPDNPSPKWEPSAWFEVEGELVIANDSASIIRVREDRMR